MVYVGKWRQQKQVQQYNIIWQVFMKLSILQFYVYFTLSTLLNYVIDVIFCYKIPFFIS